MSCICFDGVVIADQCTATFLRSIVLPQIWVLGREYADYILLTALFFSGLRFFKEPEISDSGPQPKVSPVGLVLRTFTS
jgi:hypothetical protein